MRACLVIIGLLLLVGIAAGYTENFQNWDGTATGWSGSVYIYQYRLGIAGAGFPGMYGLVPDASPGLTYTGDTGVNYIAWTYVGAAGNGPGFRVYSSGYNDFSGYIGSLNFSDRIEAKRIDGRDILYINGIETANLVSVGLWSSCILYGDNPPSATYNRMIDDFVWGSEVTDVVGLPPHTWFVGKDLLDPTQYGLFDSGYSNQLNTYMNYTEAGVGYAAFKSYTWGATPPTSGTITITYGVASDYIQARSVTISGGSTTWDKATYVTNDTGTISYGITTQYWNTTYYDYKLKVYKINDNATNTVVQSTTITAANGTGSYTFTSDGTYYAVTTLAYKSAPNTDYWLYPSTAVYSLYGVQVLGYTYDGFLGGAIPGVVVSATQSGTNYTATSNSNGYYNLSHIFSTGQQIDFVGTKANYTPATFNYTFTNPQTAQVDLTLIPTLFNDPENNPVLSHTGTAIGGYVKDDAGNFAVGTVVTISGGSGYLVSNTGTYLFDNLAAQTLYTITATKSGYVPVTASVSTGANGEITYHNFKMFPIAGTINGTTVAGYTIDASTGSVLASTSVNISNISWSSLTSSSAGGFYIFGQLNQGTTYTLNGSKSGYTTASTSLTTGAANTIQYYNLYLNPSSFTTSSGCAVGGFVNDLSTLGPLVGASVRVYNSSYSTSYVSIAPYGAYFVEGLAPNTQYTITASKSNYTDATKTSTTGPELGAPTYNNLYLAPVATNNTPTPTPCTLYVYVQDSASGMPIAGASVGIPTFSNVTTSPSPYGLAIFDTLSANTAYTVTASKANYTTKSVNKTTSDAGWEQLVIRLDPDTVAPTVGNATVYGYVYDSDTNAPVGNANISIAGFSNETSGATNGGYHFNSLTPSTPYSVVVSKTGYTTKAESVTTGAEGTWTPLIVWLVPTGSPATNGTTTLIGNTVDMSNYFAPLTGVGLALSNGTSSLSTTSTVPNGTFLFENLPANSAYTLNGTKAGYNNAQSSVTMGARGSYQYVTLYMTNVNGNLTPVLNGTAIYGLVLSTPFNEAVSGAVVTCTGQNATISDAGGFYKFENLQGTTAYTVGASKVGYSSTSTSVTTGAPNTGVQQNLYLAQGFVVTVNCIDVVTNAAVTGATVTVNGADPKTAPATYTLAYGSYTFAATASGYYQGSSSDSFVSNDKTVTIYMTPIPANINANTSNLGPGQAYSPHNVRFSVQTIWGQPIENCSVSAQGFETTAGSFEWLYSILGFRDNTTPIANASLSGTTDHLGQINFMMIETVKYNMTFSKPGIINVTWNFYPKDEYYTVIATPLGNASWYQGGYNINEVINKTVIGYENNGTIALRYVDYINSTYNGTIYFNQTNGTNNTWPERNLFNFTIPNASIANISNASNWSWNYTPANYQGQSYMVRFVLNSSVFTSPIHSDFGVTFRNKQLNPMGLTDFELMCISCVLIILMACFFGAVQAPQGGLIVCFVGWILWYLGWMNAMGLIAPTCLTLATVVAFAWLVMTRSRKGTWF